MVPSAWSREDEGMKNTQGTNRTGRTISRATGISLGILAAGSLAACGAIDIAFDVDGSGDSQTETYAFDSFDKVNIGSTFESTITIQSGEPSVEITMDDNFFEHVDVDVSNGELRIRMDAGNYDHNVDPRVVITMPSLVELDLSGATETELSGLDEDEFDVEISGASSLTFEGSADKLTIDSSGSSNIEADGSAKEIRLNISGASDVDLDDVTADTADVDLSGASSAEFGEISSVTGELSGAASLEVPDGTNVSVSTSGASSVERT